ncbi:protein of unknown function [Thauera humireducens]|nr:protein of unknown function [Thauera humireducens]
MGPGLPGQPIARLRDRRPAAPQRLLPHARRRLIPCAPTGSESGEKRPCQHPEKHRFLTPQRRPSEPGSSGFYMPIIGGSIVAVSDITLRHRRQQAGQPLRQHGLARARRTEQQQGMSPRGSHLKSAARLQLSAHIGQVRTARRRSGGVLERCGLQWRVTVEMGRHRAQAARRQHVRRTHQRRFGGVGRRHHQAASRTSGGQRDCQHATHRAQLAIQRQLATELKAVEQSALPGVNYFGTTGQVNFRRPRHPGRRRPGCRLRLPDRSARPPSASRTSRPDCSGLDEAD